MCDKKMKLEELYKIIVKLKKELPEKSYTSSLFKQGIDRIVQKIGEEAVEVVIAAKGTSRKKIIEESADLFFHVLVLMAAKKITLEQIYQELGKRRKNNNT